MAVTITDLFPRYLLLWLVRCRVGEDTEEMEEAETSAAASPSDGRSGGSGEGRGGLRSREGMIPWLGKKQPPPGLTKQLETFFDPQLLSCLVETLLPGSEKPPLTPSLSPIPFPTLDPSAIVSLE